MSLKVSIKRKRAAEEQGTGKLHSLAPATGRLEGLTIAQTKERE